jgi:hypothetical protein
MISRRMSRNVLLTPAIGLVVLMLSCGLGAVAVQQGNIAPPDVNVDLGTVRMIGLTSNMPDCTRQLTPGCVEQNQTPSAHIYTLWLMAQRERDSWDRPTITTLLRVQIRR